MAKKLYVGNLSYNVDDQSLAALFSEFTVLSAKVITDRETGRSKGFGFVELEDADALKAIGNLNGQEYDGRALTVNEARPQEERPRSGGGFGGGRGDRGDRGGFGGGRGSRY